MDSVRFQLTLEQVESLVSKGAVQEIPLQDLTPGFYSPVFVRPKRNSGKWRLIHDLKEFNSSYLEQPPYFRLLTVPSAMRLLEPSDYMVSLDLQDAYLHIPIHLADRRYLRFVLGGRHFQWNVLPFGISSAPWLFTRVTQPIVQFLHELQVQFLMYLDDGFAHNPSPSILEAQQDLVIHLLRRLGWLVNLEKSDLVPTTSLQYLGAILDTVAFKAFVPKERMTRLAPLMTRALSEPLSLRQWQRILGLLTSAQDLTIRGRLMLRPLQVFLNEHVRETHCHHPISLPPHLRHFLTWWQVDDNVLKGVPLRTPLPTSHLFVDASTQGWGAHLGSDQTAGTWSATQQDRHINVLELDAVRLAILHWSVPLRHQTLLVHTDSSVAAWTINRQGSTRATPLLDLTLRLFELVDRLCLSIRAVHIPGAKNVLADVLSRPDAPPSTEWQLNPRTFQSLCLQFGRPMLDLFATRLNCQLPIYVSPVPDPAAWAIDALSLEWEGMDAYAFPPPAVLAQVVAKLQTTKSIRLLLVAPMWPARPWGLRNSGYSKRVASALASSQRKTTQKLYDFQWGSFSSFCEDNGVEAGSATLPQIADYLVHLRNVRGLKASSINTNLAAIMSVIRKRSPGLDISVLRELIKSFRQAEGRRKPRAPEWDLAVVLDHLKSDFYEPLEEAPLLRVTVKTTFLVAMASAARISELHALQADLLRFEATDGGSASLGLAPDFVCKNQQADELGRTFHIPSLGPLVDPTEEGALSLCPVRALRVYTDRTRSLRQGRRRLFLPHSQRSKREIDRRALGVYLRSAIIEAYKGQDRPLPTRTNPHEIRAVSATMAYHRNIAVADIMAGCFWKSGLVFANHYLRTLSNEDLAGISRLGPQVFAQQRTGDPYPLIRRGAAPL
ncbi:uncharacterized protein [Haliotis asinina]|uniref:uncharacterized protein n=1 Tax=Haliotis asinina TaxID=109174 RepID=UPI0035318876